MCTHKKKRGIPRDEKQMESFQNTLAKCDLFDLGFLGRWYTWERENLSTSNIREHLDKGNEY